MKPIDIALTALAVVVGVAAATPPTVHAEEPQVEEAYKPSREQPEAKEVAEPNADEKNVAEIIRQKKLKAKSRQLRKGNHP